ncbi:hypothetical protein PFISCL1PPCAC_14931, partial [Pristionchus fissidentatus]
VGHYYIGILVILCAETFVLSVSSFSSPVFKQMYSTSHSLSMEDPSSLQMREIVQYSRAFIPSICVSSIIKIIGLLPVFAWQEGWGQYGLMRALFFTAHSINCAVMKNILLVSHSALRKTFTKTFGICFIVHRRCQVKIVEDEVSKATDRHFDMLLESWK